MHLYNCVTRKVIASGIPDKYNTLASRFKLLCGMELRAGDKECDDTVIGKIAIVYDHGRDWHSEVLFAEEQFMSDKEWLCFDRAFNYSNESYKYCKRPSDYGLCLYDK